MRGNILTRIAKLEAEFTPPETHISFVRAFPSGAVLKVMIATKTATSYQRAGDESEDEFLTRVQELTGINVSEELEPFDAQAIIDQSRS